jgi:hypothetical protein
MTENTTSVQSIGKDDLTTSRRKFLHGSLLGAGLVAGGALVGCAPTPARAPGAPAAPAPPPTAPGPPPRVGQNIPKEAAMYQFRPNGQQRCGICAHFIQPDKCEIVAGPIDPNGWCRYWRAKTPV